MVPNKDNPAALAGIILSGINALLLALNEFSITNLSPVQIDRLMAVLNIFGPLVVAWWVTRKTTPLANPKDAGGQPLAPVTKPKPVTRGYSEERDQ